MASVLETEIRAVLIGVENVDAIVSHVLTKVATFDPPLPATLDALLTIDAAILSSAMSMKVTPASGRASVEGSVDLTQASQEFDFGPAPIADQGDWPAYYASHNFAGGHAGAFYRLYAPTFDVFVEGLDDKTLSRWHTNICMPCTTSFCLFVAAPWYAVGLCRGLLRTSQG